MKKFLAALLLFFASIFIFGQQKNTYVDVAKKDTVTLNIVAENKKQAATTDNLQNQLIKSVENQTAVNQLVANGLTSFGESFSAYVKEIEKRNKSDGEFILNKLKFTEDDVKHAIRVERWLNFIAILFVLLYLLFIFQDGWPRRGTIQGYSFITVYYLVLGSVSYWLVLKFLTLLFNGDYYVIKELIKLYT